MKPAATAARPRVTTRSVWRGAYWDGSVEPVDLVSASTGSGVQKGVLGDLYEWSDQIVETADARHVVAIGANGAGLTKLYVLDTQSGLTNSVPIGREYALAGALASGALVGADTGGTSVLSVDVIDLATGSAVTVGTIEGIYSWTRQLALDVPRHRVYAIASPHTDPSSTRFYSFDLSNGASTSQPLAWDVFLGGVASDGQIVMSKNWPTSWFVGLIDPDTMAVTWKGQMGDMYAGSYLVYDPTTHVAHTVGVDQALNSYLYTFDLARNVSTKVPTKSGYVLAKRASEGAETGNTNGDGG